MEAETNRARLLDVEEPDALARHLREHRRDLVDSEDGQHHAPAETVRTALYKGHRIAVRTTYSIEVDGVPIDGHLGVTNDGQVHYHAIPNLGFSSAIDLVEKLIDAFPDDFSDDVADQNAESPDPADHGEHHP